MEITYKKSNGKNFIIFDDIVVREEDYRWKMIMNNNIRQLADISIREINRKQEMMVETTSYSSIKNVFGRKSMSSEDLFKLVLGIESTIQTLSEYLLDAEDLLLDSDCVFQNKKTGEYIFVYIPYLGHDFNETLRNFFDGLLEYVDHDDERAVLIAYGIEQITIAEDFTLQDIVECAKKYMLKKEKNNIPKVKIQITGEKSEGADYEGADSFSGNNKRKIDAKFKKNCGDEENNQGNDEEKGTIWKVFFQKLPHMFRKKSPYETEDDVWSQMIKGDSDYQTMGEHYSKEDTLKEDIRGIKHEGEVQTLNEVSDSKRHRLWSGKKKKSGIIRDNQTNILSDEKMDKSEKCDDMSGIIEIKADEESPTANEIEAKKFYLEKMEKMMKNLPASDNEGETMLLTMDGAVKPLILKHEYNGESLEIKPLYYPCVVGTSKKSADVCLDSRVVSRVHLKISEEGEEYLVEDLNSTNGTFLNGERLAPHEACKIEEGDVISIADLDFAVV